MWNLPTTYLLWATGWVNIPITQEKYPHDIATLLATPMTNSRWLIHITQKCPEFQKDIISLPPHATLAEFWCGNAITIQDLLRLGPDFKIQGIDCIPPQENRWFDFICGDLNTHWVWERIPDKSLDYAYSFYTSMYLKNPLSFLKNVQSKLKENGSALIHLWYIEQYIWWLLYLLSTVFSNFSTNTIWVWDTIWSELFPMFLPNWIEHIYKNNLSIEFEPLFVKIDKHTDLDSVYDFHGTQWFFIKESKRVYKTRQSDKRFTYTIAEKH
jgi:SAM-dependent methyltransferase